MNLKNLENELIFGQKSIFRDFGRDTSVKSNRDLAKSIQRVKLGLGTPIKRFQCTDLSNGYRLKISGNRIGIPGALDVAETPASRGNQR